MPREVIVSAPAKVNLHLEILGLRSDGYHEILTLFQLVSLSDEIRMRAAGSDGNLEISGKFGFPKERNSIINAVELFRAETGIHDGLAIDVEKRIPLGAGLGGGSSDAAAALRGLQALFDSPLSGERLAGLGRFLGSDVPFFLGPAAAIGEGRGERLHPIVARSDYRLLTVSPPSGVATADAYRWVDEARSAGLGLLPRLSPGELADTYGRPVVHWRFSNDFDPVIFGRFPGLARLRERMADAGAASPRLTGSGSTVIGVFQDRDAAESCARRLTEDLPRVLEPLAKTPPLG